MQRYDTFQSVLVNVNKFNASKKKKRKYHAREQLQVPGSDSGFSIS